jgi:nitrogen fixation/metabolism regulation signal transduction histidine kinase
MDLISDELKRLARLLNDMLNQSKHTPEVASHFDMVNLIADLLTLTRYQIVETITLTCEAPEHLMVHLPQSGMRQALLNLILNAADALDNTLGLICIKVSGSSQGLRIDVCDNGHGFSQDMLSYGIRPFRTSRARGTGLGLAMVQRFVKDCDGSIKLSNQEPCGACVSVFLPKECLVKEYV